MAPPCTHLLWLDLETTGTNEMRDAILEVAVILTDMDLQVMTEYTSVVQPHNPYWSLDMNDFVKEMHRANGLIDAIKADEGQSLGTVETDITMELTAHEVESHAVMLAGSGVGHFDLRFVKAQMPHLAKVLAYPVIDIGVMRRFLRDICLLPEVIPDDGDADTKTHRALDDIRQHLSEAQHYRNLFDVLATDDRTALSNDDRRTLGL